MIKALGREGQDCCISSLKRSGKAIGDVNRMEENYVSLVVKSEMRRNELGKLFL